MPNLFNLLIQFVSHLIAALEQAFLSFVQLSRRSLVLSTATDLTRGKIDLIAENALLRQQLIIFQRQIKTPHFTQSERLWLVLLASRVQNWKGTLLIPKPEPLLGWHRQAFGSSGNSNPVTVALVPGCLLIRLL